MSPPPRITLRTLVADFLRDVTQAERGLLGTMIQLTFLPARVINTYLYVDRSRFLKPTRYLVFCFSLAALQLFILQSWYGKSVQKLVTESHHAAEVKHDHPFTDDTVAALDEIQAGASQADARRLASVRKQVTARIAQWGRFATEFRSFLAMLFLPVLGLLYYTFFGRHGFNLAETLVAAVYIHAHVALLGFLFVPLHFLGSDAQDYALWTSLKDKVTGCYLLFAVTQVFARRWWDTIVAVLWFLLFAAFGGITAMSLSKLIAEVARLALTSTSDTWSWLLVGQLVQVIVIFPLSLLLLYRYHPQRPATSIDHKALAHVLLFLLFVASFVFSFTAD